MNPQGSAQLVEDVEELRGLFAEGKANNEGTAYPWWGIVKRAGRGKYEILAGPFFSRKAAEQKRTARIYSYGEKSLVYCFSGHESPDYRMLLEMVGAKQ